MNRLPALLILPLIATLLLSGCARGNGDIRGTAAASLSGAETQAARATLKEAEAAGDPEAAKQARIARNKAIRGLCGTVRVRDQGWQNRLADEVAKLPPDSILIEALNDGALARDAQSICRGEYERAIQ